jgi:hypothetical protein
MAELTTGITIDIIGMDIVVHGNTFHIKDDLQKLGMRWNGGMWRYAATQETALDFLNALQTEFPGWGEAEFGDLYELI